MTLPIYGQMYQQVAATITLRSTNAEVSDHPCVERLYALQDLESTIPHDLMAYRCCKTNTTNIRIHSYPSEKYIDFLNNAAFKAAMQVLYLNNVTLIFDDNTTQDDGPQDLPSMSDPAQLTGTHFLNWLRIMLTISARLTSHPDHFLFHKMFANIIGHLTYILQRDNPLEVHDPTPSGPSSSTASSPSDP
ncbi:MAG: hypothetical protein L6R42_002922 [Xanthoria sp. 1 TBL-2021]|nr:MAG: hypothetical protein L6R42_002922 [Xanthoria sp. 1 TBL-2021]